MEIRHVSSFGPVRILAEFVLRLMLIHRVHVGFLFSLGSSETRIVPIKSCADQTKFHILIVSGTSQSSMGANIIQTPAVFRLTGQEKSMKRVLVFHWCHTFHLSCASEVVHSIGLKLERVFFLRRLSQVKSIDCGLARGSTRTENLGIPSPRVTNLMTRRLEM